MLIRKPSCIIPVTIATTAVTYTTGYQVGVPVEIPGAVEDSGSTSTLVSVSIQDKLKQSVALDLLFFSQKPAAGTNNIAISVSAADVANLLGVVKVTTAAYSALDVASIGSVYNIGLKLKASKAIAAQSNSSIWMIVVARGGPTYAANTLVMQLGIDRD